LPARDFVITITGELRRECAALTQRCGFEAQPQLAVIYLLLNVFQPSAIDTLSSDGDDDGSMGPLYHFRLSFWVLAG
jgi:hypothetical protein